jgi:hypothetical protein
MPATKELTIVQRLGMVFYWCGLSFAAIVLALSGFLGIQRVRNGAEIELGTAFAFLLLAGVLWLIGRAFKYVLVGQ